MSKLSPHQQQIVSYLAQGYMQKDVAEKLHTGPTSIAESVKDIRKKRGSLERAIQEYLEQQDGTYTTEDEIPDEDEPTGPVMRCIKCGLVQPHECLNFTAIAERRRYRSNPGLVYDISSETPFLAGQNECRKRSKG